MCPDVAAVLRDGPTDGAEGGGAQRAPVAGPVLQRRPLLFWRDTVRRCGPQRPCARGMASGQCVTARSWPAARNGPASVFLLWGLRQRHCPRRAVSPPSSDSAPEPGRGVPLRVCSISYCTDSHGVTVAVVWTGRRVAGRSRCLCPGHRPSRRLSLRTLGLRPPAPGQEGAETRGSRVNESCSSPHGLWQQGPRDRRSYENPVPEGPRRGRGGALAPGLQTRGAGLPCWPLAPCSGTAPQPGSRTQEHELARLCFAFPGSRSWWRPGVSTRCVPTSAPWLCLDTPAPQAPVTQWFPHRGKQTRPARCPSPAVAVAMAA